jgi:hypothetical protein
MLEERHPIISACLQEVAHMPVDLQMQVADASRPPLESLERPATPTSPQVATYARPAGHEIF